MKASREDQEKRARIAELLRKGLRPIQIRERLACSSRIVTSVQRELDDQQRSIRLQQEQEHGRSE